MAVLVMAGASGKMGRVPSLAAAVALHVLLNASALVAASRLANPWLVEAVVAAVTAGIACPIMVLVGLRRLAGAARN